uniref:Uncharacterized protein n=1 Tax=Dicentrarchus labrax TaxID=13489 RepID=A0A8C4GZ16_DICLA
LIKCFILYEILWDLLYVPILCFLQHCQVAGKLFQMQGFTLLEIPFRFQLMNISHISTVGLPVNNVTPEGVISVAQWVLVLLICYGMITIAFLLVTFLLRWLWRLLKVGVALACFGLILNDHSVGKETVAIRLVCLGCVCIILSIRPRKDWTMAARNVNPEQQVKLLENRVREMEKWRKRCVIFLELDKSSRYLPKL